MITKAVRNSASCIKIERPRTDESMRGLLCSVRQAEGSLLGLGAVDAFDPVTGEGADDRGVVITTTAMLDLGDAGDRDLALERLPGGRGAQSHGHLDALVLLGQTHEDEQLAILQRPPNDLDLVHGDMNQHGSGHLVTPFLVEPKEPRQTVVIQGLGWPP